MKRTVFRIMLMSFLVCILIFAFNMQSVKAPGTIYIRADGSVDPSTALISTLDNVTYTLTGNINGSIVVDRDNIVVDGAGYTVQGTGSGNGIDLTERSNVTVKNMEIKVFRCGIYLYGSSDNVISENSLRANIENGISLDASSNNTISGNRIENTDLDGLCLTGSSNNSIFENNIENNGNGIVLDSSSTNVLRNNIMTNNAHNLNLRCERMSDFANDVDISNIIDGKPVYYWVNKRDVSVPLNAGYVALVNCTNIRVEALSLTNNGQGILIAYTQNSTILDNNIAGNVMGIDLYSSSNNRISGNNIVGGGCGIRFKGFSNNNAIFGNRITIHLAAGIILDASSNNTISRNHIKNYYLGHVGIRLQNSSSNNTISENNITENSEYGIALSYSSNNSIYHNSFINNKQQVFSDSANVWDDGYPSGGNYWSDRNPPDEDMDKIGDVPYVIDENNTDRYPLIYPCEFYKPGYVPKPDLDNDGIVNIVDVATVAKAFGTKPGDSNWNPITDVDINGTINILDVATVAKEFGKEWEEGAGS